MPHDSLLKWKIKSNRMSTTSYIFDKTITMKLHDSKLLKVHGKVRSYNSMLQHKETALAKIYVYVHNIINICDQINFSVYEFLFTIILITVIKLSSKDATKQKMLKIISRFFLTVKFSISILYHQRALHIDTS